MSYAGGKVGTRGTTMAITCAAAITLGLGAMWVTGRDIKGKEGKQSPYREGGTGGSDKAMTSGDVSAAVSKTR